MALGDVIAGVEHRRNVVHVTRMDAKLLEHGQPQSIRADHRFDRIEKRMPLDMAAEAVIEADDLDPVRVRFDELGQLVHAIARLEPHVVARRRKALVVEPDAERLIHGFWSLQVIQDLSTINQTQSLAEQDRTFRDYQTS